MSNGADGLLIVDKPPGWTSHDVVARARRLCGTRKVGHAGTLDPMATGVLVLGVNRATRLLTFLVGCDKTYTATIRLGEATVTDDAEGELTIATDASGVTRKAIGAGALSLTGPIQQVPSSVSAIKVRGERAYHRVRQGEDVQLSARPVTVHRLDVLDVRPLGAVVDVDIEVEVSSGTYVRALARDLGTALGVGGHLTALRRTRVGRFDIVDAHDLESLASGTSVARTTQVPDAAPRDTTASGTSAAMATQVPDATARDSAASGTSAARATQLPDAAGAAGATGAAGEAPGMPLVPMGEAARAQFVVHEVTAAEARAIGYGQRIASARLGEPVVAAIGPGGLLVAMLDESAARARAHVVFQPS